MSIIYEALKKVQGLGIEHLVKKTDKEHRHGPRIYLIYAVVVLFGVFLANLFFTVLPRQLSPKVEPQDRHLSQGVGPQSSPQAAAGENEVSPVASSPPVTVQKVRIQQGQGPAFVLNGVFFSGDEGYALINNRILKKGDQIDGATVVRIDLDEVELESAGTAIKLSGASQ